MMYLTLVIVFVGCYSSVNGGISIPIPPPSSQCTPPNPVSTELFEDLYEEPDQRDEIERALDSDNDTRMAVLTDKALNEVMSVAVPVVFQTKGMCKYKYQSFSPGRVIWWQGQYCRVLWYFWYQNWNYVYCPYQYCSNVPCNKYTPYVYRCVPSCYRTFALWIYCSNPTTGQAFFQKIEKRLPQCCECRRYKC